MRPVTRAALGRREHHAALQILNAVREGAGQFGSFVELTGRNSILRICRLEKLQRCFSGLPNLVGHGCR